MIIGVDFDGTVVTHEYPNVGVDIGAVPFLQAFVENGHKIVLCTMRSHPVGEIDKKDLEASGGQLLGTYGDKTESDPLQDAVDWFAKNKIPLYGVNECPGQKGWTGSPKPYAQLYIDDAALGCPVKIAKGRKYVDWKRVGLHCVMAGIITVDQYEQITNEHITKERK